MNDGGHERGRRTVTIFGECLIVKQVERVYILLMFTTDKQIKEIAIEVSRRILKKELKIIFKIKLIKILK